MNPLKAGDKAPQFSLPDQDGEIINLSDYQGQRVLVYFYPKAMTQDVQSKHVVCVTKWIHLDKRVLKF